MQGKSTSKLVRPAAVFVFVINAKSNSLIPKVDKAGSPNTKARPGIAALLLLKRQIRSHNPRFRR